MAGKNSSYDNKTNIKNFKGSELFIYKVYKKMKKNPEIIAKLIPEQYKFTCSMGSLRSVLVGYNLLENIFETSNEIYNEELKRTNDQKMALKAKTKWELSALKYEKIARENWEQSYEGKTEKVYASEYRLMVKNENGKFEDADISNWKKINPELCFNDKEDEMKM